MTTTREGATNLRNYFSIAGKKANAETAFFPRVRTPCGHGAQVIIEGREKQSDGGERNKDNPTTKTNRQPQPKGQVSTIL